MKKLLIILLSSVTLVSCDPDIPGEGITLPQMEFGFKVSPDTAYIKLGDTITLSASISNVLTNGTVITDGKAVIDLNYAISDEIPLLTSSFKTALYDDDFKLQILIGDIDINASTKKISSMYAVPFEENISIDIKIIPLKKGTHIFALYSKFFEGSQGKTRTQPFFEMPNHHFDELWEIPGGELGPGDYGYDNRYLFAVYE